jgi:hypothetical protein
MMMMKIIARGRKKFILLTNPNNSNNQNTEWLLSSTQKHVILQLQEISLLFLNFLPGVPFSLHNIIKRGIKKTASNQSPLVPTHFLHTHTHTHTILFRPKWLNAVLLSRHISVKLLPVQPTILILSPPCLLHRVVQLYNPAFTSYKMQHTLDV